MEYSNKLDSDDSSFERGRHHLGGRENYATLMPEYAESSATLEQSSSSAADPIFRGAKLRPNKGKHG